MSQNFEMKINPLPAKTWNWLHMNGTVLKEEIITERRTVKADRPETVTETECRMENLIKPETQAIQTKIYAEENAVLHLIQVQRLGSKMTFLDDFGADCEKNARMETIQLVLGGKDTYLGNRTALRGESSDLESDIGYLLGGESRLDMNLEAVHTGKKTNSQMDAAGVLSGKAVKIFRGTIDFQKGCAGSVGNEKEDVLLLDDTIVNQTIPLILCNEEDVEGNHGATIGKLDEELLLYLESRGISEEAVYAMMAQARIDSICHKISDEEMKKKVQEYLEGEREE